MKQDKNAQAASTAASAARSHQEEALDDALEDTFPASDPVALAQPHRPAASLTPKIPKVELNEDAVPAEKPA